MRPRDEFPTLFDDIFAEESEGVRLSPGSREGELVVEYIRDHHVHSAVFQPQSYFDFISFGSLKFLHTAHAALTEQNAALREEVARLKQMVFGTSSEKSSDPETNPEETPAEPEPVVESKTPKVVDLDEVRESRGGRKPLPATLPRETVPHELKEHERICPCCQGKVDLIGEETTEQLTVIPAQYKVLRHVRKKYVCRKCEKFVTAPGPKALIQKSSYASPEFLAHVACSKYQFGLPFYRQEAIFEQSGLPFNRTTLANLMIGVSDKLYGLWETLREQLLQQGIIHADETRIQVLKEPGRKATTMSQLWLYRSREDSERSIVLFEYRMTRGGMHPRHFLGMDGENPFAGYLQVDGYDGYNGLSSVTRIGCMAHVRRKFFELTRQLPEGTCGSPAQYAVALIGRLYAIERRIKGLPHRERYRIRQAESVPILREFKTWLDDIYPKVTGKTGLGKAVRYAYGQWDAVVRYVDDGRLAIDNNIAERDIKSVVIGRKNWLFADSVDGANTNAVMYSLVLTAKANGIDPFKYLRYVIATLPTLKTAAEMHRLLPWNMPQPAETDLQAAA